MNNPEEHVMYREPMIELDDWQSTQHDWQPDPIPDNIVSIKKRKEQASVLKKYIGTLLIGLLAITSGWVGFSSGRWVTRTEAAMAGAGNWRCDPITGEVTFEFVNNLGIPLPPPRPIGRNY
jgi:hypothetical protein